MKTEFYQVCRTAKPNPSHEIWHRLHKDGKLLGIITQVISEFLDMLTFSKNIDHLHESAGVPVEKIISLHGSESVVLCVSCKKNFTREEIHSRIVDHAEKVPKCSNCGGNWLKSS